MFAQYIAMIICIAAVITWVLLSAFILVVICMNTARISQDEERRGECSASPGCYQ